MALADLDLVILPHYLKRDHLPEVFLTTAHRIYFLQVSLQLFRILTVPVRNTKCLIAVSAAQLITINAAISLLEAPVVRF